MWFAGSGLRDVAHVAAASLAAVLRAAAAALAEVFSTPAVIAASSLEERLGSMVCCGARCARCLGTDKGGLCKYTENGVGCVFGKGVIQRLNLILVNP